MKNNLLKKYAISSALMICVLFSACKKNKNNPEPKTEPEPEPVVIENTKQTPTTNRRELTNDSLFLYAKEIYFWNTALPTYDAFEPRKYISESTDLANYELNLFNVVKSSDSPDYISSSTYSKYSFIEDITTRNPDVIAAIPTAKAYVDLEGNGNDMGIYDISAVSVGNNTYRLYILAVSKGSPVDLAKVTRGSYITKINGTNIGRVSGGKIASSEISLINATIFGDPETLKLEGLNEDGIVFNVTLQKAAYKSDPIYKTNILTSGSMKVGYLAYARFSNAANSLSVLDKAFSDFASSGVTDLIIDLRFNGGGYVSTAEHLINLIAPSTAKGTMYVEHFNNNLKTRKRTDKSILSNQPLLDENEEVQYRNGKIVTYADIDFSAEKNTEVFDKAGTLTNIKNVVFIVSGNTASASELVINSLKPHMTVKLVGQKTYGKPIGFFPIRLENRYDVYFSLYESKNSKGEGGYYNGITPDNVLDDDLGTFDFGNPQEVYLKKALNELAPGDLIFSSVNKVSSVSARIGNVKLSKVDGEFKNDNRGFVGMIDTEYKIRK